MHLRGCDAFLSYVHTHWAATLFGNGLRTLPRGAQAPGVED